MHILSTNPIIRNKLSHLLMSFGEDLAVPVLILIHEWHKHCVNYLSLSIGKGCERREQQTKEMKGQVRSVSARHRSIRSHITLCFRHRGLPVGSLIWARPVPTTNPPQESLLGRTRHSDANVAWVPIPVRPRFWSSHMPVCVYVHVCTWYRLPALLLPTPYHPV